MLLRCIFVSFAIYVVSKLVLCPARLQGSLKAPVISRFRVNFIIFVFVADNLSPYFLFYYSSFPTTSWSSFSIIVRSFPRIYMASSSVYSVHLTGSLMICWIPLMAIMNRRGDKADLCGVPIFCFFAVECISLMRTWKIRSWRTAFPYFFKRPLISSSQVLLGCLKVLFFRMSSLCQRVGTLYIDRFYAKPSYICCCSIVDLFLRKPFCCLSNLFWFSWFYSRRQIKFKRLPNQKAYILILYFAYVAM